MMERLLRYFDDRRCKTTFFTTGDIARAYPEIVRTLIAEGHEIACHSDLHTAVSKQSPAEFKADLERNRESLTDAGATEIAGFRAPYFSITSATPWAHSVLRQCGFTYSSSVLPARNPLHGHHSFGVVERLVDGVYEIPVTLSRGPLPSVPIAGGVYLRAIPQCVWRYLAPHESVPLVGYLHPYDIDTDDDRFDFPEIGKNRFFNWLLHYNRGSLLQKLDAILERGYRIISYAEYVSAKTNLHAV
jgi:polysaccharide deacetylase family protein (PEP-CTERM system associated)